MDPIPNAEEITFIFDGKPYPGRVGDTLASALLANGVQRISTSIRLGRPRGILSAGSEEPCGVIQIEAPFPEPMLTATTVELYDGLVASSISGQGRLAGIADPARYDARNVHCDVLVIGAGVAGLTAAQVVGRGGLRVILLDDQPAAGGQILSARHGDSQRHWVNDTVAELAAMAEVTVLQRTTAFGYFDANYVLALERRTNHLGNSAPPQLSRERVWRIRARHVIIATGAHERSIAFAHNDIPGVMLAGAASTYLNRFGVLAGTRAVLFTTNDNAYRNAWDLADAGVDIAAILDVRPALSSTVAAGCASRSITVMTRAVVRSVHGTDRVTGVEVTAAASRKGTAQEDAALEDTAPEDTAPRHFDADLLLVSGGWNPAVQLFSQAGGTLRYDHGRHAFVPDAGRQAVEVAGSANGVFGERDCMLDGSAAGMRAAVALGALPQARMPATQRDDPKKSVHVSEQSPSAALWFVEAEDGDYSSHFVDLQRDVTVADLTRAVGAGLRSVEHIKRYTTAGTAHDQGKTSGVLGSGVLAQFLGIDIADLGVTSFRAPYTPVSFAALAGRNRGWASDPVRITAVHDWHVAHGAVFENVGQWKRPYYYPRPGENMAVAVARECIAARKDVAFMDASTLGKIEVQGPDAPVFLDLIYTNLMSSLKVGCIRYGVMCRPDGMIFDDGTAIRLTQDRYLISTTTGNAAPVLAWLEEWLQTEWPHLRVFCTSVTEQWATMALVGPHSRSVLAALAPALAVSAADFGFMTWRDTTVAGLSARVCRISFSGELAYEINVAWWQAPQLWDAVEQVAPAATPYGTESMHVLRAEKGYPIVGQDTDGTITPHDLGMGWAVSSKKAEFIGKRSFALAQAQKADRKHLVGLLPEDRQRLVPEGSQLVEFAELPPPPVEMLGHVTSSYHSAELGGTFCLALLRGGRERIGQRIYIPNGDEMITAVVTDPVLLDPAGSRRDGRESS